MSEVVFVDCARRKTGVALVRVVLALTLTRRVIRITALKRRKCWQNYIKACDN